MKRGYADTPQGQIHYMTAGEGEPLLLLHQTGSSRQYWKLMPILAERCRTFAPDNLGSGNSDPLPPNVQIADLARSMIHFMDFLGIEKAHIFGFHTGNKIATEMAAAWPSRVDRLILCGQTHSIMAGHEARNAALKAVVGPSIRKFEPEPDGSHLVKQWAADFGCMASIWWDTANFAREQLTPELFQRRKDRVIDQLQIRDVAEVYRAIFAFDLGARMRQIKARTLIIEVATPQEEHLGRPGGEAGENSTQQLAGHSRAHRRRSRGGGRGRGTCKTDPGLPEGVTSPTPNLHSPSSRRALSQSMGAARRMLETGQKKGKNGVRAKMGDPILDPILVSLVFGPH